MAVMTAIMESAFLTGLNAERKTQQHRAQKRQDLLENLEGGGQILKLHGELQGLADLLDDKVENKLNANENAFFLAYKNFMYTVQKEFKELKQKADEEETKTRRDAKIQSLEKELDWFMHEALRLDELCKKHKKDLDRWKGKAEALEDDRQFLENSIKTAKRNNKSLRGAVEKAQTSAYSALVAADGTAGRTRPPLPALVAPGHEQRPAALMDAQAALALEDASAPGSGLSRELEERYQAAVRKLKQQLQTEQRLAGKLRAVADRQFGEPSELEAFFVDCVDRVKVDVEERRRQAAAVKSQGKSKSRGPPAATLTLPPVNLDDLTVSDRRRVVELLLSSEEVLQFLYDKLFPVA